MKKALLALVFLAGSAFAGPRFSFGIGFGAPAPVIVQPVCPGPGYVWVDGYYGAGGVWAPGFWRAPAVGFGYARPGYAPPRYYTDGRGWGHDFHNGYRHEVRR